MSDDNIEQIIREYYYDPQYGFAPSKIYQRIKDDGYDVSRAQITSFLKKQKVNQIMKPVAMPKKYNSVLADYVGQNYQIDIIVYDRYTYHNYKYILCCVDTYSRYALAKPMTNRFKPEIKRNLEIMFEDMGMPETLNADNEFNCKLLNEYFRNNNIKTFFSQTAEINKQAIVERLNRTIAEMIQRWRIATKRYDWYNVLDDTMFNYNNNYHRTIKAKPIDIYKGDDINNQVEIHVPNTYNIGDKVRKLKREPGIIFIKGDDQKYSKTVYTVSRFKEKHPNKIYITNPNGEELEKYFKPYELLKIDKVEDYKEVEIESTVANAEAQQHKKIQKERKFKRDMNKEGIEIENIINDSEQQGKQRRSARIAANQKK